jgi:hypothetical protein
MDAFGVTDEILPQAGFRGRVSWPVPGVEINPMNTLVEAAH